MRKNLLAIIVLGIIALGLGFVVFSNSRFQPAVIPVQNETEKKRIVLPEFIQSLIQINSQVEVSACLTESDERLYGVVPITEDKTPYTGYDLYSETGEKVAHCPEIIDGEAYYSDRCSYMATCTILYSPELEDYFLR